MRERSASRGRHRAVLHDLDEDPMTGMANLFDTGLVFSVALIALLLGFYRIPELLDAGGELATPKRPGTPGMEVMQREGVVIERSRVSTRVMSGQGERLGTAYRLESGEVVYVPDSGAQ